MARFKRSTKDASTTGGTTKSGSAKTGSGKPKAGTPPSDAEPTQGRVAQVKAVWSMTRKADPKLLLWVLGPALGVLIVLVVVGLLIGHIVILSVFGVLAAIIAGAAVFGRRATGSLYASVEGKPGAAAAVLQGMRGDWVVTPAVGFTRNQDLIHRVIGRAGIVIVGEGPSTTAIRQLIVDQKRRVGRVAPATPVYDVVVGDEEGRVPVRKLQAHMMKLPRNLKKGEISGVESRMKALGGTNVPMPKGPMPTRMPRGKAR
jgi:Domain of unknown function (DUF4191)